MKAQKLHDMPVGTIVPEAEVKEQAPLYHAFNIKSDFDALDKILPDFEKLKRGQKVLSYDCASRNFIICKVSSINFNDIRAVDGPLVRVQDGKQSWRVDGNTYAVPV